MTIYKPADEIKVLIIYEPCHEKSGFCIYEKAQISCAVTAQTDQGFCFRYIDSTIPLLSQSKISSL